MLFIIIKKEDLSIRDKYESEEKDDTSANRNYTEAEPFCTHLPLPQGLDPDCVKAVLVDDVITLVEDADKTAAKALATKNAQVEALHAALNTEVYAEMARIYSTTNSDSAVAFHETWKLMADTPADYVTVSGLADAAAVQAYAEAKLAEVKAYSIWRLQKINEFVAAKAVILGS